MQLSAEKAVELSAQIRSEVAVTLAEGLELSLWASDSIVNDPIAISTDPYGGIYYTQGNRIENSEFDIRGHRDWMTESISWQSVEDKKSFIHRTFTDDSEQSKKFLTDLNKDGVLNWKDLTVEKEEVWRVFDSSNDGIADRAKLYIADFHTEISDLANGIEYDDGNVYIAVGPDLWKTRDTDGNGIADQVESLAHGFAVHIGFGAHGMSGAKMGPDGRIWWGIGDIGMNVTDKEGKNWKYPNRGVIVRCETDGSNFEVFSMGHRNTHEFVFDKYGNLISVDNDGDHPGERERLVYIVNGSDSGWRINWQFGKYTDPDNNLYKVWMDEKMYLPRWEGQAAYFIPPISNYVNGPTGMVYNPGTALGEAWYDHFFIAEFRGTAANSPIHAFTLEPDGAGFVLKNTSEFVKGLLPTGLDFGADGALYSADWIDGWGAKHKGRIWKIDQSEQSQSQIRKETQEILQSSLASYEIPSIAKLLAHQDMRVRQKAQFQLVKKGEDGYLALHDAASNSSDQMAIIHGLWGMAQFVRKDLSEGSDFVKFLDNQDEEIIAQAARQIGDFRYDGAGEKLIQLVNHSNPRIRFFATEALGRIGDANGLDAIIQMLITNDNEDLYLRHSGALALARIGDADKLCSLAKHSSRALRIAAVVALRRLESPGLEKFLQDEDEYIVAEAARAINDDWSVESALPALAALIKEERFQSEALLRRIINANLRVGKEENLVQLMDFALRESAPATLRAEAISTAMTWANPSVLDRVDGRYRGEVRRDEEMARNIVKEYLPRLLQEEKQEILSLSLQAIGRLELKQFDKRIHEILVSNSYSSVRQEAIKVLNTLQYPQLTQILAIGLNDKNESVRSVALGILPDSELPEKDAVQLLISVLEEGSIPEKQVAISSIGKFYGNDAVLALDALFINFLNGTLADEIKLDVLEAIRNQNNEDLIAKLGAYEQGLDPDDLLANYSGVLAGGDANQGRNIFFRNEAVQCVRCHAIWEWGGDAGPGLQGVASRLSKEKMLESLIQPSAEVAKGFAVASLDMKSGETLAGVILSESKESMELLIGSEEKRQILKSEISKRIDLPSSMPSIEKLVTKIQIRDLIAFLSSLEEEEQ